jgi:AraC-like DNA-binding protein
MDHLYDDLHVMPSTFKRLTSTGLLFAYYICPPIALKYTIYTEQNFFLHIHRGRKILHTAGESYTLMPGTCVLVRKGAYIMEWFADELEIMIISIPEDFIRNIVQEVHPMNFMNFRPVHTDDLVLELKDNTGMQACLDSMLPYFHQIPQPSDHILELKFREFILNVLLNPGNRKVVEYFNQRMQEVKPSVQDIMEKNFMHNVSLLDYAKLSFRSLAAFKREFKELYGVSPGRWILQKRLDYAKNLLLMTQKSINEVATESGFENTTHFSRVFKDKFGMPPTHYRKSILE